MFSPTSATVYSSNMHIQDIIPLRPADRSTWGTGWHVVKLVLGLNSWKLVSVNRFWVSSCLNSEEHDWKKEVGMGLSVAGFWESPYWGGLIIVNSLTWWSFLLPHSHGASSASIASYPCHPPLSCPYSTSFVHYIHHPSSAHVTRVFPKTCIPF